MGHYDDLYDDEFDKILERRKHEDQVRISKGYEKVPEPLQQFLKQVWIHKDELKVLRRWLNTCPYCKLADD